MVLKELTGEQRVQATIKLVNNIDALCIVDAKIEKDWKEIDKPF